MDNNSFEFSIVSVDEAREVLDGGTLQKKARVEQVVTPGGDLRWMRRPSRPEDRALTMDSAAWMQALPRAVRPLQCALHYPRIINCLSALAQKPDEMKAYLLDLVRGTRDGRQGFRYGIPAELASLQTHVDAEIDAAFRRWH